MFLRPAPGPCVLRGWCRGWLPCWCRCRVRNHPVRQETFDGASARNTTTEQASRKHASVIDHEKVAWLEQQRQRRDGRGSHEPRGPRQEQQTRVRAIGKRRLCDQFRGKIEVELADEHPELMLAEDCGSRVPRPTGGSRVPELQNQPSAVSSQSAVSFRKPRRGARSPIHSQALSGGSRVPTAPSRPATPRRGWSRAPDRHTRRPAGTIAATRIPAPRRAF
jgi:hypothetical protein